MGRPGGHNIEPLYKDYLELTKDPVAAAILVFTEHFADIDHEICMGIRMGLFGARAGENASILELRQRD